MKPTRTLTHTSQVKAIAHRFTMAGESVKAFGLMALVLALLSVFFVQFNSANAGLGYDVPEFLKIETGVQQAAALTSYPMVLSSTEKSSSRLTAFTKWSSMFERFEQQVSSGKASQEFIQLKASLYDVKDASLSEKAKFVNDYMNARRYITDGRNWGQSDYWATPAEFLQRGGDCEDFAIAKYVALRMVGVSDQRLRIAIVQDTWKNIAHAVLVVYTEKGPFILDNQTAELIPATYADRYEPIFSINRQAWWLHKKTNVSRVASAY